MTPSKLAFLILEAKNLEELQQKVRDALIHEHLLQDMSKAHKEVMEQLGQENLLHNKLNREYHQN